MAQIKSEDSTSIAMTLDRFEEGKAVLVGDRDLEISIPKRLIPKKCREGDVVHVALSSDEAETKRREQTAKELLNEILSGR